MIKNKLILTFSSFLFSLLILGVSIFAWFTISNQVDVSPIDFVVTSMEAKYEFFLYIDKERNGDETRILHEQIYQSGQEDDYYLPITSKADSHLFNTGDGSRKYAYPGDVYSFALRITNLDTTNGLISINLNRPSSLPDTTPNEKKIQRAFYFQVTKYAYFNGTDEISIDSVPGTFQSTATFFTVGTDFFSLANNVELSNMNEENDCFVIYFDIVFEGDISKIPDYNGSPMTSEIFQELQLQKFQLFNIQVVLDKA